MPLARLCLHWERFSTCCNRMSWWYFFFSSHIGIVGTMVMLMLSGLSCFKGICAPRFSMIHKLVSTFTNCSIYFVDNLFLFWFELDSILINSFHELKCHKITFCNLGRCLLKFSHHEMGYNIKSQNQATSLLKYTFLQKSCYNSFFIGFFSIKFGKFAST
jgi:hypothetical protein